MASFCNKCAYEMWGEELSADINVPKIFRELKHCPFPVHWVYRSCLCEGCSLEGIVRTIDDKLLLLFSKNYNEKYKMNEWIETDVKEYIIPKNKRRKLSK